MVTFDTSKSCRLAPDQSAAEFDTDPGIQPGVTLMKSILVCTLAAATLAAGFAQAAELVVKVSDVRAQKGRLLMAVFDSADAWDGKAEAVAKQAIEATSSEVDFHFPGLVAGRYAVSVMHDENGNGKLDSNFMGMPIEGYGFSNDPQVMRKATFDEAAFAIGADNATIELHLR
jgi:uncharacterized protein (DUF2141 family)